MPKKGKGTTKNTMMVDETETKEEESKLMLKEMMKAMKIIFDMENNTVLVEGNIIDLET